MILSCQGIHSWKVINSLISFHFIKPFAVYSSILPHYIPILFIIVSQLHVVNSLGNIPDNIVLCLRYIHNEPLLFFLFLFSLRSFVYDYLWLSNFDFFLCFLVIVSHLSVTFRSYFGAQIHVLISIVQEKYILIQKSCFSFLRRILL